MDAQLPPPVIAVIGCDGSGKSTVCDYLYNYVNKYGPTVRVHLGKQAGNVERRVAKLPLVGNSLGKSIDRNRVKVMKSHFGLLSSLVMFSFVIRRRCRFRRMLKLRRRGLIILADRFPQVEIPGGYDGTLFPPRAQPGRPLVNWLAGRERAAFHWMASHQPDLVLKLDVDLDVACSRKPDHRRESLAKKVAVTGQLTFPGSQLVTIDANQPLAAVLDAAERAVAQFMAARGYDPVADQSVSAAD